MELTKAPEKKTVSLSIEEEIVEWLNEMVDAYGWNRSELVSKIVREEMDKQKAKKSK